MESKREEEEERREASGLFTYEDDTQYSFFLFLSRFYASSSRSRELLSMLQRERRFTLVIGILISSFLSVYI